MEDPLVNDDAKMEVLSRLSTKDLYASKCVSKRWNSLISNPSFLRMHSQRSKEIPGLFIQWDDFVDHSFYRPFTYIRPCNCEEYPKKLDTLLDFLPERVIPMASCNGLLCCRSSEEYPPETVSLNLKRSKPKSPSKVIYIYVCNPTTKEWITISRPTGSHVVDRIGLAFYPFGSSSSTTAPSFKLVSIRHSSNGGERYSFVVYSSETGRWRTSKQICHCNYEIIDKNREIFVGQRFHWLTMNHHIITFDVERELSGVIELPGPMIEEERTCLGGSEERTCLGGSEGYLHYVCVHSTEIEVWMLKDYFKPEWVLKYHLTMFDFCEENPRELGNRVLQLFAGENYIFGRLMKFLGFDEDVLLMCVDGWLYSYNLKTRSLKKHCPLFMVESSPMLLYSVCLAAGGVLKSKSNGDLTDASSFSGRPKRTI